MASGSTLGMLITSALMSTAGKLLTSLGIGAITYAGLDYVQRRFVAAALDAWGGLPADAVQLMLIAGVGVALNWVFGAISFVVTYRSTTKLGRRQIPHAGGGEADSEAVSRQLQARAGRQAVDSPHLRAAQRADNNHALPRSVRQKRQALYMLHRPRHTHSGHGQRPMP